MGTRDLIETLIKRWRSETNMFQVPFGELMVTLEDVNVLLMLPVEVDVLLSYEGSYTYDEHREVCQTYLGLDTKTEDYKNNILCSKSVLNFMVRSSLPPPLNK